MNGAIADPFASTSSTPTRTSVITIGASQYFLFSRMNCHSSLITCTFDIYLLLGVLCAIFAFSALNRALNAEHAEIRRDTQRILKHLFVVTRILLPLRIRNPERFTRTC